MAALKALGNLSKMRRKPTSGYRFYVYDLIDPRTGDIFWVGSGTGTRHERSRFDVSNPVKRAAIVAIEAARLEPISKIILCFRTRAEALVFERERQRRFGLPWIGPVKSSMDDSEAIARLERAREFGRQLALAQHDPSPLPKDAPPVASWCSHPHYKPQKPLRFMPYWCYPEKRYLIRRH